MCVGSCQGTWRRLAEGILRRYNQLQREVERGLHEVPFKPEASFRVRRSMAACSCSKPAADSGKIPAGDARK
jgi:hypothetical protein